MSLPFMKAESEESATQAMAFIAVAILTLGLMVMNVSGAIAGSVGMTPLAIVIRGALAVVLAGAELLAAVAIVRVMLAPNRLRKALGLILFIGLAWACIQNGKRAVHLIYPEFKESSALLTAKAGIAGDEAALISEARGKAINATPEELARVRTDIAALKAEQQLMASQSPEKIKEAQALLIAQGKYFGRVDGLRETLTEAAMRSRGEEIGQALTTLALREEALAAGAVTAAAGVAATAENPAILQADLEDKARKAKEAAIWLEVMLWVVEGARSLGLWVYVTTITSKNRRKDDQPAATAPDDGLHEVRMTAEEREAYDKFKKRSEAAALRAKLPIEHREWMRDKKKEIAAGHSGGLSALEIYEASGFVTWHEFENFVNKVFNGKAAAKILGTAPPVETPDPRASTKTDVEEWVSPDDEPPVAVSDSPQDEPEPEAEPDTDEPAMSETAPEPEAEPEPEPLDETPEPPQANGSYGVAVWKSNPPTVIDDEAEDGDRV